jgi:methionine sulfoxide reductase heme-binding subunit
MPFLRERSGRWSPIKIVAFALAVAPALWIAWQAAMGELGARPLDEALHQAGDWTVRLLLLSLAVSPARRIFMLPSLLAARRTLGVAAFAYVALHFVLYVVQQKYDVAKVASEIVLRIYLTIGFVALVGLMVLAITSTDTMVKRLGGLRWQALHRIVYGLALLAIAHFLMQTKLDVFQSIMMAGLLFWLLAYRLGHRFIGDLGPGHLALLAILTTAATAFGEAAWYGLTTGVNARLVLAANLDVAYGLRPAAWVLVISLAVALAAAMRALTMSPATRPPRGRGPRPAPVAASPRVGGETR